MIFSSKTRTMRQGFTLVEMLVVVAIIGILAGLISAVAVKAIGTAKRMDIVTQLSQLDLALKTYKDKYGEYPPDGADQTDVDNNGAGNGIPDSFERHFQKVFPKANLVSELTILAQTNRFPCDPANKMPLRQFFQNFYNPSTALVFWLGGMQEDDYTAAATKNPKSRFVGFSANPIHPLSDGASTRLPSMYEFDINKINDPTGATTSTTFFRSYQGNANVPSPFVYFRAEINLHPFEYSMNIPTKPVKAFGNAKPYFDTTQSTSNMQGGWINPTSYQILFCGFDNTFGVGNWYPSGKWSTTPSVPAPANWRLIFFRYDNNNYDDITNFAGGAVGDKVP